MEIGGSISSNILTNNLISTSNSDEKDRQNKKRSLISFESKWNSLSSLHFSCRTVLLSTSFPSERK